MLLFVFFWLLATSISFGKRGAETKGLSTQRKLPTCFRCADQREEPLFVWKTTILAPNEVSVEAARVLSEVKRISPQEDQKKSDSSTKLSHDTEAWMSGPITCQVILGGKKKEKKCFPRVTNHWASSHNIPKQPYILVCLCVLLPSLWHELRWTGWGQSDQRRSRRLIHFTRLLNSNTACTQFPGDLSSKPSG